MSTNTTNVTEVFDLETYGLVLSDNKLGALVEQIEDRELAALAEERIAKYGGEDEAFERAVSSEEFWGNLGVTGDLSNVEEFEIA